MTETFKDKFLAPFNCRFMVFQVAVTKKERKSKVWSGNLAGAEYKKTDLNAPSVNSGANGCLWSGNISR